MDVPIRFLGVYDTVGALGVPATPLQLISGLFERVIRFHDTQLGKNVTAAYQALAINEHRGNFKLAIWSDTAENEQKVLQVWFSGAHSDVGGGYGNRALADITLDWMLRRAIAEGLPLDPTGYPKELRMSPLGPRHNSTTGVWKLIEGSGARLLGDMLGTIPLLGGIARIVSMTLGIVTIKPYERPVVGEQLADDGSYAVPVGAKLHHTVPSRYGTYTPPFVQTAMNAKLPVFYERAEPRLSVNNVEVAVNQLPARLLDCSSRGARVSLAFELTVGSECHLKSASLGESKANVAWAKRGLAGLRFVEPIAPQILADLASG